MPACEVLGLRGEERAIARRSVDEDKGWRASAVILKSQLDAVSYNRRHEVSPSWRSGELTSQFSKLMGPSRHEFSTRTGFRFWQPVLRWNALKPILVQRPRRSQIPSFTRRL
jgi:hypothetical protein